ncbi:MAG: ABC transporter ATP-binding protein [Candidatus Omnitrophota bacterium]
MANILEIENLSVTYGKKRADEVHAVRDITFSIDKGEIFGFLGPNGAGKTTTIKTLLGIIVPTSGSARLFGKPISYLSMRGVGYMPEVANYYWYLTPREILAFYGSLFGISRAGIAKRSEELLELVGLKKHAGRLMRTFSKGMLQKVSFAQALINDPELLILDEPTTGLDPISKMNMRDTILKLKSKGKTIFFSSHELSEVEIICDRVAILKNGTLLKLTHPKNLLDEKGQHVSLEKYFFDMVRETEA